MRLALATLAAFGALAPGAWAQDPGATPTPTPPPESPQPAPELADASVAIELRRTITAERREYLLGGDRVRVVGRMEPAAKGEQILVRFSRDGKLRRTKRAEVNAKGVFRARWRTGRGAVRVVAIHKGNDAFKRARSAPAKVRVLKPTLGGGTNGPLVRLYQRGLAKLGFATSRSGRWDDATARASMAYRKTNGMPRSFSASRRIVRRVLAGKGAFKPRYQRKGRYVEADLSRQILVLIEDGKVYKAYHTSSGAPSTPTVLGTYSFYRKDPGTNSLGMVHSSYFIRGYAIHGYKSVPPYGASHGCLRVPVPDAWHIYSWIPMGAKISVYR